MTSSQSLSLNSPLNDCKSLSLSIVERVLTTITFPLSSSFPTQSITQSPIRYFYALAHQTSFDVKWIKNKSIGENIIAPLAKRLQERYVCTHLSVVSSTGHTFWAYQYQ